MIPENAVLLLPTANIKSWDPFPPEEQKKEAGDGVIRWHGGQLGLQHRAIDPII